MQNGKNLHNLYRYTQKRELQYHPNLKAGATADGGSVISGHTGLFGAGGSDVYLVKTGVELGLACIGQTANTVALYRGATDPYWNYVRVRVWKIDQV